jgi:preprotein translocase subunit SecD
MLALPRWKFWLIIFICVCGVLFALPNMLSQATIAQLPHWLSHTLNLGLELRGGSHLQLEVDLKAVAKEYLGSLLDDTRAILRKEQIGYLRLTLDQNKKEPTLFIQLKNPGDFEKVSKLLRGIEKNLKIELNADGNLCASLDEKAFDLRTKSIIDQSIEVIRRRIDESGTKEPIIQRQGSDRIIVQLPGVEDPAEVKQRIGKTAKMTFRVVDPTIPPVVLGKNGVTRLPTAPSGVEYLLSKEHDGMQIYLPVRKQIMVSGETLADAQVTYDQNGRPAVSLKFNSKGARKFADMSKEYEKKQFAIVLDSTVISAPVFQGVIPTGEGQISGSFDVKEATDLALLLRAGALPAPLNVIEERTVGPSLGADSIKDGQMAIVIAFLLVSTFMILSYAVFGLFADIALVFNLIFLFAGLSLLQATLTLPGIAGIALTIGMAVDANVLIYERIKEEIRAGVKPVLAVDAGYKRAMMTIIDSNLTTLFGAAVLFEFGTGPIRGFAVTLALGIFISLFTALSLSRLIIIQWLRRRKIATLPI